MRLGETRRNKARPGQTSTGQQSAAQCSSAQQNGREGRDATHTHNAHKGSSTMAVVLQTCHVPLGGPSPRGYGAGAWEMQQVATWRWVGACKTDCKLVFKERYGREKEVMPTLDHKGARQWLYCHAGGQRWCWGRLVAWCFSNPSGKTWRTFWESKTAWGAYRWQCGHLGLDECDYRVHSVQVQSLQQNRAAYRAVIGGRTFAERKYNKVRR